jgi:acetyl-CoA carboxylase biotin carboxyl carrier protein
MADEKRTEKQEASGGQVKGKIDLETIRQLLTLMTEHDVAELEIEQEDLVVRLRKAAAAQAPAVAMMPAAVAPVAAPAPPAAAPAAAPAENLPAIKSPIVGTFYVAPSPEAPAFVKVGDHVNDDTVVCIIEAMKVFNEIRAEMSGTIEKILVKNEQAVEFGTALYVVRPD